MLFHTDPDIAPILEQLETGTEPIMVTGKAGTGKSTLVRYIRSCGDFPNTAVLAPTGIAAINIGGQTLHSFFRLPLSIIEPGALKGQRANPLWKKVDIIIIDEISMVRADILDGIDYILRKARKSPLPFGGCKMVFIGDFYQLPPVVRYAEGDMLRKMGYASHYFYSAKILDHVDLQHFTLRKVYRQSEDDFLAILADLRMGQNIQAAIEALNARCQGPHRTGKTPLLITATNATAARYNADGLAGLKDKAYNFTGKVQGKFNLAKDKLPAPETLTLKVGARVMALKNDKDKRWVNGSLGTVTMLSENSVFVEFDHRELEYHVDIASWDNIKYVWDEEHKRPVAEVMGSYCQVPLTLAWAVTIHKAQGLTLDDVRVDLGHGAFAPGQTYVALSRARTLDGLSLSRPLLHSDIRVERRHQAFLNSARENVIFTDEF